MAKHSRLRRDYLLSYVFVFAIPFLILGFFIYMNAIKYVQDEIKQSNGYKLKQVQSYLDEQIIGLKHLAAKMAVDQRLTPYVAKQNDYNAGETVKELSRYKDNSLILEEMFLYYRGDKNIISTEGIVALDVFTNDMYRFPEAEKGAFLEDLTSVRQETVKSAVPVAYRSGRNERLLTYMFPVMPYSSVPHATVLFLINETALTNTMKNMLGNVQGAVFLLNERGDVLATERSEESLDLERIMRGAESNTGETISIIGSTRYSVMSEKSGLTGWTYMIVMPTDQFWYRVIQNKLTTGSVLLAVLVIGLSIAIFISFKQSGPIRALVAHLQHRGPLRKPEKRRANEIDWIRGAVDDMHNYTHRLETDIEKQRPLVIDQMLYRMLTGSGSEPGQVLYPEIQGDYYFVMIISYPQENGEMEGGARREAIYRLLNRIEAADNQGFGLELLEEQAIAVVISLQQSARNAREQQRLVAVTIQSLLLERLGINSLIGVGTICRELAEISRSFIEGLATIEYRLLFPEGHVLFFEDVSQLQDRQSHYPMGEQLKFIQSLKLADQAFCLDSLETMLDNIAHLEQPVQLLRYHCFDIVNAVLKEMRSFKLGLDWPETKKMMEFQTLEDLRESMRVVVTRFCDHVEAGKKSKRADLCSRILYEIDTRFRSDQLSLEGLAKQFDVSASYISRLIREQTGTSFTEYVMKLRIEAVKKEMIATDRPIKDIIIEAGYQDMSSFIKKFKRSEGLTPGEYRKKSGAEYI